MSGVSNVWDMCDELGVLNMNGLEVSDVSSVSNVLMLLIMVNVSKVKILPVSLLLLSCYLYCHIAFKQ